MKSHTKRILARTAAVLVGTALSVLLISEAATVLALGETFRARATVNLCGDYRFGGVTLSLKYRVGTDTTTYPITILSQNIDSLNNTGTFEFNLPSTLQNVPLQVSAYCTNSNGTSRASNEKSLTNCQYLSQLDTDNDGIKNHDEDIDCTNQFSPGDLSNPDNVDTDGDGERDLAERVAGYDATNPGSGAKPRIISSDLFDYDGEGSSNAVAWRPSEGRWYIKDAAGSGNHSAVDFGVRGDIPFTYRTASAQSDFGVIRRQGTDYQWMFHGPGFERSDSSLATSLLFGNFGDNIVLGPWEVPGVTSPAVARLYNGSWAFYIYLRDGTIRESHWGGNGDTPVVADYDGDGLFDLAVYRVSEQKIYIVRSSNQTTQIISFGSGTADYSARGDYTGDGKADINFWEPISGLFYSLKSNLGFNATQGNLHNPLYYQQLELGTYEVHMPLAWNKRNGKFVYTVANHDTGERMYIPNNVGSEVVYESWGLKGDSLG